MEALIFIFGLAAIFVANALVAWVLAWLFTEVIRLPFNVKPLNCRGCLSFWFTFVLGIVLAWVVTPYVPGLVTPEARLTVRFGLMAISFLLGIINFLYIKTKFRIYE